MSDNSFANDAVNETLNTTYASSEDLSINISETDNEYKSGDSVNSITSEMTDSFADDSEVIDNSDFIDTSSITQSSSANKKSVVHSIDADVKRIRSEVKTDESDSADESYSDDVHQFDDSVKVEDAHDSVSSEKIYKVDSLSDSSSAQSSSANRKSAARRNVLSIVDDVKPVKTEVKTDESDSADESDSGDVHQFDDSVKVEVVHDSDASDEIFKVDSSTDSSSVQFSSVNKKSAARRNVLSIVDDVKPVKTEVKTNESNSGDVHQFDDSVKVEDSHDSDASDKIYKVDSSTDSSSAQSSSVNKKSAAHSNVLSIVDDVIPVHTGKTGMETFKTQQSMAVGLLQNLCKSLDAKPSENDFAEDPKGLKIELKPHQKHALKWMSWREGQKPRGGILADDMGLGKTLSMISLILMQRDKNDTENAHESSDSDSDEEESKNIKSSWIAKGSSNKSYYYGGTLVVCPSTIMDQWKNEIKNRVSKNLLTVVLHHGSNRETMPRRLSKVDMVITTYGIVQSESTNQGALFSVKWERIILDEAHNIRNHTTQTSIACCKLKGSIRWALTGTPVQNKELDLYALLKFLRCHPFDDYSSFKMWISKSSTKSQERLNQVLQALLLRRTKEDLKNSGQIESLPEKRTEIISVNLTKDEMNVYQKVLTLSQNLFAQFLQQRENRNYLSQVTGDEHKQFAKLHQKVSQMHHGSSSEVVSGHHILILILRLRQICIHPCLIHSMLSDGDCDDDSETENLPEIDLLEQLGKLKIADETEVEATSDENISKASSKVMLRSNPVFDTNRISSKFQKLIECIHDKIPAGEKGIVVSQFTTVLKMFAEHLKTYGIKHVMLTGETKIAQRNDIVVNFNSSNSSTQIMLLSLNTGGVGLNLCGANHLFFVDPHWNPQLESQAQDRIYRMGQTKSVIIYKFLCEDTIERRIQHLQETKLQMAEQILTGAQRISTKLTIQDMKTLFEL